MHRINTWLFPPHFSHLLDSIVNSKLKIAPLEFFNVLIFWNKSYSQVVPFAHVYEEICFLNYCLETNLPDSNVIIKTFTSCKKMQCEVIPKWITVILPLQRGGKAGRSSWALSEIPPYTDKVESNLNFCESSASAQSRIRPCVLGGITELILLGHLEGERSQPCTEPSLLSQRLSPTLLPT